MYHAMWWNPCTNSQHEGKHVDEVFRSSFHVGELHGKGDVMKYNEEFECMTVGELKKLLESVPDEWVLVTTNDEADCVRITHVNSYWHGALTFEWDKD